MLVGPLGISGVVALCQGDFRGGLPGIWLTPMVVTVLAIVGVVQECMRTFMSIVLPSYCGSRNDGFRRDAHFFSSSSFAFIIWRAHTQ